MPKQKKEGVSLSSINNKIDTILKHLSEIKKEQTTAKMGEEKLKQEEKRILEKTSETELMAEAAAGKELSELERLELLEKHIQKQVEPHPLRKITYKDIVRGSIGAFFGASADYAFIYGLEVAQNIDFQRATILFGLTFLIGGIFIYLTGFRKIKDPKLLSFLPLRLIVLYITTLVVTVLVLAFFQKGFGQNLVDSYKQVSTVSLLAMLGAATADLIGRGE